MESVEPPSLPAVAAAPVAEVFPFSFPTVGRKKKVQSAQKPKVVAQAVVPSGLAASSKSESCLQTSRHLADRRVDSVRSLATTADVVVAIVVVAVVVGSASAALAETEQLQKVVVGNPASVLPTRHSARRSLHIRQAPTASAHCN